MFKRRIKKEKPTTIAFCGGHHTSSLPVIDELQLDASYKIIFIGRKKTFKDDENDSLEYIDIMGRGIKFYDLRTGKFFKANPLSIFKILIGFFHSIYILIREDVRMVVSFGGYIAVPVVLAAFILRKKIITHEQTVITGLGNKFISYFADRVLLTWPSSLKYFDKRKSIVIGLPLRKSFFEVSRNLFPIKNKLPTIFITCGKTGSHIINKFILDNLEFLLNHFNLIHQSGDYSVTKDFHNLNSMYLKIKSTSRGQYYLQRFLDEDEVNSAFQVCDFIVSRSGAHTIFEILHFRKKAIMIPIPWVSQNEQYLNAKLVYDAGLGLVLEEANLNLDNFKTYVKRILSKRYDLNNDEIEEILSIKSTDRFINEIKDLLS